jgi:integrase
MPYVKSYKKSWDTDESMIRNHIVTKLGELHMGSISPPDIAVFVETMRAQDYALGTCNRALVLLRYGYELAIRWKVQGVESNPVKEIKNLKDDNRIERFLSNEQTIRLLDAVRQSESEMLQYIVLFLIYTGARKREALDAKWQDIDWDQKSWRIPKTKSGRARHVPLSKGAVDLIASVPRFEGCPYFLPNPQTYLPFVSIYHAWNTARTSVGLADVRIHDLRHSFASFLINAGRSIYEVQKILGHTQISTTQRYSHLSQETLIDAADAVTLTVGNALSALGEKV